MLALLFIVPLVSLVALWVFAASVTLSSALQERDYSTQNHTIGAPAEALGVDLTLERLQSFIWLSGGRRPTRWGRCSPSARRPTRPSRRSAAAWPPART